MKRTIKRIVLIVVLILIALIIPLLSLFHNEIRSLATIRKVDDYGMFQMTYYGDYGFDEFLKVGATNDAEIEAFVTKKLLKGIPIKFDVTGAGCTAFVTRNENSDIIYGRNFDFDYAPSLQLVTAPKDGYASISTVNLAFAGYSKDNLPSGIDFNSFLSLAAPYLPFDGMNEKGLAIALLAVPEADIVNDENKITLNTTTLIRLVLDKAASVDEAVSLMHNYNVYFSGGIECHFLIADAFGKSVLVEYYDGDLQIVETDKEYQIASNFIAYNGVNIGEGFTEFERYEQVENEIQFRNKSISEKEAIDLLIDVGVYEDEIDKLQWSVVYNLTKRNGTIFANRNKGNLISFEIK